jgi:hypothetical protein
MGPYPQLPGSRFRCIILDECEFSSFDLKNIGKVLTQTPVCWQILSSHAMFIRYLPTLVFS